MRIARALSLLACALYCQTGLAMAQSVLTNSNLPDNNPPTSASTSTTIADVLKALNLDERVVPGIVYLADAAEQQGTEQQEAAQPAKSQYWLGIALAPVDGALKAQMNRQHPGVLVVQVLPDSPAAKAKLQEFDVIVQVNDQVLELPVDLTAAVEQSAGKELTLLIVRAGQEQQIKATPDKRPAPVATARVDPRAIAGGVRWLMQRPDAEGGQLGLVFHPGMVQPEPALPKDMSISLEKQGDQPARITVKQGDKSWTVSEETLAELPQDVLVHVERILRRPQGITMLTGPQQLAPMNLPAPLDPAIVEQLKQMNQQLQRLQLQVDELNKQD